MAAGIISGSLFFYISSKIFGLQPVAEGDILWHRA